jgi:hypothetical protein
MSVLLFRDSNVDIVTHMARFWHMDESVGLRYVGQNINATP